MDFTLSLAHFCELHGPTTLLCTQALPAECSACYPSSSSSSAASSPAYDLDDNPEPSSYFLSPKRPSSSGTGALADGDRCASCRISLPDDARPRTPLKDKKADRPALRTREDIHVCARDDGASDLHHAARSVAVPRASARSSCHSHRLVYLSSSGPADSETFASLRRATVRTLSGEQLPRGQTSGPLWFGDPTTGYTIAYVFRLPDVHARGRQRYYALLALAGSDTTRAFEACSTIWNLFEQIAMHVVRSAEAVAHRSPLDDSPPQNGTITPVSSFLTGRRVDPDGFPRRGMASVRANGIADLVDNDNFFCELHMIFVGMLQELGRMLGGMKVRPAEPEAADADHVPFTSAAKVDSLDEERGSETDGEPQDSAAEVTAVPAKFSVHADDETTTAALCQTTLYSPNFIDHRQQVVV